MTQVLIESTKEEAEYILFESDTSIGKYVKRKQVADHETYSEPPEGSYAILTGKLAIKAKDHPVKCYKKVGDDWEPITLNELPAQVLTYRLLLEG